MSSLRNTYEEAAAYAAEQKLWIVHSHPQVLQLDLDSSESVQFMKDQLSLWVDGEVHARLTDLPLTGVRFGKPMFTRSRNRNWHAYIRIDKPLSIPERITYQSFLGSDRKRELLSMMRFLRGEQNAILLFEIGKYYLAAKGVGMTIDMKRKREDRIRAQEMMEQEMKKQEVGGWI